MTEPAAEASAELRLAGFSLGEDGTYRGWLHVGDRPFRLKISIPGRFPTAIPEVFLDEEPLPHIPHLETNGKLCIAPSSGVLLDATRPRSIVREALDRGKEILRDGIAGVNRADFFDEYSSYLDPAVDALLLCEIPRGGVGLVAGETAGTGSAVRPGLRALILVSSSLTDVEAWSARLDLSVCRRVRCQFFKCPTPPLPPARTERWSTSDAIAWAKGALDSESTAVLKAILSKPGVPIVLLLGFSHPIRPEETIIVGLRLGERTGGALPELVQGFRPGNIPASLQLTGGRAERVRVGRLDKQFVLPRGGARQSLADHTIVIAGCGAVGSYLARHLAGAGCGTVHLVDHDDVGPENTYRHFLGVDDLGKKKAVALAAKIGRELPGAHVIPHAARIEDVARDDPTIVRRADLLVLAIAEPTIEILLASHLHQEVSILHAWNEPLGLGGHVLYSLRGSPGCFACLFRRNEADDLVDQGALAAPGQDFARAHAGCAGLYVPFSALDADRTAIEAARAAIAALEEANLPSVRITWTGQRRDFEDGGLRLSERGRSLPEGVLARVGDFAYPRCRVCGAPAGE